MACPKVGACPRIGDLLIPDIQTNMQFSNQLVLKVYLSPKKTINM